MIVFHEGLPGSGKSYEAVVKHLLPAIKSGRQVYANIKGLNSEKIAEILEMQVEEVDSLITFMEDDDVLSLDTYFKHKKDCIVFIDELQNYYPASKRSISEGVIKYVSEHRHDGHDIIIMGQSFKDIHPLWRRRTQRKIVFFKRTAIGQPDKYTWSAYEARQPEVFDKITSGGGSYDKKYFGSYSSHKPETSNVAMAYGDDRTNVLKKKSLLLGMPAAFIAAILAVWFLVGFFSPEPVKEPVIKKQEKKPVQIQKPVLKSPVISEVKLAEVEPEPEPEPEPLTYIGDLAARYTFRLSGSIYDADNVLKVAFIDVLDDTHHLKERFNIQDIEAFGYDVIQREYGVDIIDTINDEYYVVRPFPLGDLYGRVNHARAQSLR